MLVDNLSPDLLYFILKLVPNRYLVTVSLACRKWYIISFPLLHHTISLANWNHAVDFTRRILDETDQGQGKSKSKYREEGVQVANFVRRLYISQALGDGELVTLGDAISKLARLEHLHWEVPRSENEEYQSHSIAILRRNLCTLRSLSLVLAGNELSLCDLDEGATLTKLRDLSIRFNPPKDEEFVQEPPTMLLNLICSASNLESLNLEFQEKGGRRDWSPLDFFSALSQIRFPNLRRFRSYSRYLVPSHFFDKSVFRQFIRNHPQLHTITLDTSSYGGWRQLSNALVMTPEEIAGLVPAVRHFAGPCVMFVALLWSALAEQLETLTLIESWSTALGCFEGVFSSLKNFYTALPCLRRLRISSNSATWDTIFIFLEDFAWRVPGLEELTVDGLTGWEHNPHVLETCLRTLKRLARLRTISLSNSPFNAVRRNTNESNKKFFLDVATICPLLESVHYIPEGEWAGRWDILRRQDGLVDIVYMRRPGSQMPHGWNDGVDCSDLRVSSRRLEFSYNHDAL